MCGRTGLSLGPGDVQSACAYRRSCAACTYEKPEWSEEHNLGKEYSPSYNIAPTEVTPVLVAAASFGAGRSDEQLLKPMMWGMVPPWHKGDYKKHGLSTNNCRLEGVLGSRLYGSALRDGNRCVVLAEGFYEWQTTDGSKQPYYIFTPQADGVKMYDPSTWNNNFSESGGWEGVRLLRMAGLYGAWCGTEAEGGGALYSYSVLTMEANSTLGWLHHRMPALLETDERVMDWLDVDRVDYKSALSMLQPSTCLSWYPVSTFVNNSRNKAPDCNRPADPGQVTPAVRISKAKPAGARSVMDTWLKGTPKKKEPAPDAEPEHKKMKKDSH